MAQRLIKRVAQIQPPDVSVAGPAQIVGANAMLQDAVAHYLADRRRPDQKSVVVVMNRRIVAVEMETEFCGVTFGQKVLNIDIADVNLLVARFKGIEPAVCVFLQKIKISQVVVNSVRTQVSED